MYAPLFMDNYSSAVRSHTRTLQKSNNLFPFALPHFSAATLGKHLKLAQIIKKANHFAVQQRRSYVREPRKTTGLAYVWIYAQNHGY